MYLKHKDYCKCAERTDGSKCEFCIIMKKVRSYKNREKSGFFSETSQTNFNELKRKFEECTGLAFSEHGRENTKEKPTSNKLTSRIASDTFSYENNKIYIKNSKGTTEVVINLETRSIYFFIDGNYSFKMDMDDGTDICVPLSEISKSLQKIEEIKKITTK